MVGRVVKIAAEMKSIRFGQDLYLPEFGARDLELLVAATQNNESQESKSNENFEKLTSISLELVKGLPS